VAQFAGKADMLKTERGRVFKLAATLLLGWPLYLVKNAGSLKYAGKHADHFWPWSPIFVSAKERLLVAVSDVALVAVLLGLRKAALVHGAGWVIRAYGTFNHPPPGVPLPPGSNISRRSCAFPPQ
jgi:omega-6 fatty acid desaturase (delta-12 desaturase)